MVSCKKLWEFSRLQKCFSTTKFIFVDLNPLHKGKFYYSLFIGLIPGINRVNLNCIELSFLVKESKIDSFVQSQQKFHTPVHWPPL